MKRSLLSLAFLLLAFGVPVWAADAAPAPTRSTAVVSPDVHTDRQVTFRLLAPKASEVVVAGQWSKDRAPMTKDANGIWSVTVGPLEPGIWEYAFHVDGLAMIDPGNSAIKPMRAPRASILHLPGNPALVHDFQDVPHGVVHQHTYRSKALGRLREMTVYTPPGYDAPSATRFPTLYLQHGGGDNQATWTTHGKAHWILDNLIAAGRARPMVVVMMDGHAAVGRDAQGNTAAFERDLLEEVLPFIEATYRVKSDAASRAIVGLSMGGGQALTIGLTHLDRFAWVGGFSSGSPVREAVAGALANPTATNRQLQLLWIACGKDDFLFKRVEEFVALLKEKGVHHEWSLTAGDHSWPVWRGYLATLAPRLFQP